MTSEERAELTEMSRRELTALEAAGGEAGEEATSELARRERAATATREAEMAERGLTAERMGR